MQRVQYSDAYFFHHVSLDESTNSVMEPFSLPVHHKGVCITVDMQGKKNNNSRSHIHIMKHILWVNSMQAYYSPYITLAAMFS